MNSAVNISVDDLGVRVANLEVRKKAKLGDKRHSGFFITINTNYLPADASDAQECAEKLREAVKAMLTEEENLKKIVYFLPSAAAEGHTWSGDTILDVSSQFVVERGRNPKGGRIHAHATLHIDHKSLIRINIPAIKEVIMPYFDGCTACNVKNLYINVRMIGSNADIRNYLTKESA